MDSWFISVAVTVNLCAFSFLFLLLLFNTTLGPFVEKNVTLKLCFVSILSSLKKRYKVQ